MAGELQKLRGLIGNGGNEQWNVDEHAIEQQCSKGLHFAWEVALVGCNGMLIALFSLDGPKARGTGGVRRLRVEATADAHEHQGF